ncbi:hypothetical protein ACLVWU_15670 [Bdellovibrio sp. HCB290]|uniref:hypothetical protein n=1 Tax=Bdellovibrio sp. HCB290 TaxID=3394356 RepID=UPI0039B52004
MKSLVILFSVFFTTQAFAITSQEMRDRGCLPQRSADGSITMKCPVQKDGRLNAKAGDVITHINGEAVDSPEKAMELYQATKANQQMTIQTKQTDNADTN